MSGVIGVQLNGERSVSDRAKRALVDEGIHCLADRGTSEFWAEFVETKRRDT
jgi:hypothetical protein